MLINVNVNFIDVILYCALIIVSEGCSDLFNFY